MAIRAVSGGTGKVRHPGRITGTGSGGGGGGGGTADTWDPARLGTGVVLSNGDKTITTGASAFNQSNCGLSVKNINTIGKAYFEVLVGAQASTAGRIGIGKGTQVGGAAASNYFCVQDMTGLVYGGGSSHGAAGYVDGDVIGIALDATDPNAATVAFYKNNVANGSSNMTNLFVPAGSVSIIGYDAAFANHVWTLRTTVADFSYSPPSGYTAWASAA